MKVQRLSLFQVILKIPKVIANTKGATDSNYNVFIEAVTRTSVTIGISQVYTGTVSIHAIGS